jgi:hypothetical protein
MLIIGPQTPSGSLFFRDHANPIRPRDRAVKRVYVNVLFRPIAKIRLIWAYF